MSWNDSSETIVAGTGQVYVADAGAALPATVDADLGSAWTGLGYHTEDGVSTNKSLEIVEFGAWQTRHKIRRERESEEFQISFTLLQWNEDTVPLAFGGGEIEDLGGGHFRFVPPGEDEPLDERALVCDVQDGETILRFRISRGNVVEGVETQFQRSEMAGLAVTFKALEPEQGGEAWDFVTNSLAFTAGS